MEIKMQEISGKQWWKETNKDEQWTDNTKRKSEPESDHKVPPDAF